MKLRLIARIAMRSVLQNPRRSALFGSAIFLSAFLFLLTAALYQGAGKGTADDTREILTGEACVLWESVDDYARDDVMRLFNSRSDPDRGALNARAIAFLARYAGEHASEIAEIRRYCIRSASLSTGAKDKASMLYFSGVGDLDRLIGGGILESAQSGGLRLEAGSILLSQEYAQALGLSVGSYVTVLARSSRGAQNAIDARVGGMFRNKAPWINSVVFCGEALGRELYDEDKGSFDAAKVFLRKGIRAEAWSASLAAAIKKESLPLVAQSGEEAGSFFLGISRSSKAVLAATTAIFFLVIGLGLQSTTRLLLYQRAREMGALRAIGYSRSDCVWISIAESAFLALAALVAALAAAAIAVIGIDLAQLRVPDGPLLYLFGADRFHPSLGLGDVGLSLLFVTGMAILAPLKPALELARLDPAAMLAGRSDRRSDRRAWA